MSNEKKLLKHARERFGGLTKAEVALFRAAACGTRANLSAKRKEDNDPAKAEKWGNERVLKANRIEWLCTDSQAMALVTFRGLFVIGARVDGKLGLSFAKVPFPLAFGNCSFTEKISLLHSHVRALSIQRSRCHGIEADRLRVDTDVFLRNTTVHGEVRLLNAILGSSLDCDAGQFHNPGRIALGADGLETGGDVFLRKGFRAEGEVSLKGATIHGDLDCHAGLIVNPKGRALAADEISVDGRVILSEGFTAVGELRLIGASIGGILDCHGASIQNSKRDAIVADGLEVRGSVHLRDGFRADGQVRLVNASIQGTLDCENGAILNPMGVALEADGLKIGKNLYLREGFQAVGHVDLVNAIVEGFFHWHGIASPADITLDLRSSAVRVLRDDPASWPDPGKLQLHGFRYDDIADESPRDAETRIKWLRLQSGDKFQPQPYEQLAKVLRKIGREEDVRKVLIAKNQDPALIREMSWRKRQWHSFLGLTICYGYRPMRAFWIGLVLIIIGTVLFEAGCYTNAMMRTKQMISVTHETDAGLVVSDEYPRFISFVYSVDTFVPLVDLHQASYFLPNASSGLGLLLTIYMYAHIAFGWIITTLLVVSMTGLLKK